MAGASDIRAGRAFVELGADDKRFKSVLDRSVKAFQAVGARISRIGRGMATASAAVFAPLAAVSKMFVSMGSEMKDASDRIGASVESLSALKYAAEQSGTSFEALEGGMRRMSKVIGEAAEGAKSGTDALAKLGLTVGDVMGLSPDKQFKLIADRLSQIEDPTLRAAAAMEVFGRGGTALLPMIKGGASGLEEYEKAAAKLGLVMSGEAAAAAESFGDDLDTLWKVLKMGAFSVGAALVPTLKAAAVAFTQGAAKVVNWLKTNKEMITTVGAVVVKTLAWTAALGAGAMVAGKLIGILAGLATAIRAIGVAMMANPVLAGLGLLAAAIGAVVIKMKLAEAAARATSSAMQELRQKGDDLRATDQLRLERLKQLSEKERLNNAEMGEAKNIIAALSKTYGDMGVSIDAVTGKLTGLAAAQDKVNAAMKSAALAEIDAEIAEAFANFQKTKPGKLEKGSAAEAARIAEREAFVARIKALTARKAAIEGGDADALSGDAKTEAEKLRNAIAANAAAAAAAKTEADAKKAAIEAAKELRKIEEDEADRRGDAFDQEIAQTRRAAQEKLALIEKIIAGSQSASRIDTLRQKQAEVIAATEAKVADIRKKQGEAAGSKRGVSGMLSDHVRALREFATEAAYQGRNKLLNMKPPEVIATARGTFNPAALLSLQSGGPVNRIAKATEETAKNTRKRGGGGPARSIFE